VDPRRRAPWGMVTAVVVSSVSLPAPDRADAGPITNSQRATLRDASGREVPAVDPIRTTALASSGLTGDGHCAAMAMVGSAVLSPVT